METLAVGIKKLQTAFPKMGKGFFDLLSERIIENDFTEKRLLDAVDYILDNFRYKELNIADIISFDRKVKLYTGREFISAQSNGAHYSEFEKREINGVDYFFKKVDLLNG